MVCLLFTYLRLFTGPVDCRVGRDAVLKKLTKLLRGKAGVTHNASERERINRVIARDGKNARAIGHDDMLALANDAKSGFLESANCCEMINAGNLGQD